MNADEQIRQDREILAAAPKDSDDWDNATWAAWWRTAERHDPHFSRKVTTAAAVAAQGALPVPVGDQPQPLGDTRLAEIAARVEAASKGPWKLCEDYSDVLDGDGHQILSHFHDADGQFTAHARQDVPALLAEVQRLKAALGNAADQVAELESDLGGATARVAELETASRQWAERWQARCDHIAKQGLRWKAEADGRKKHGEKLRARVAELEAERHTTNEALSDAAEQLRANRDRIRELERPAVEAKRDEVRQSYAELAAQCREDRDHEGAFDVECRLREREEQWKREDANPTTDRAEEAS